MKADTYYINKINKIDIATSHLTSLTPTFYNRSKSFDFGDDNFGSRKVDPMLLRPAGTTRNKEFEKT